MMERRLAPGCCRELPRTPVFNQVTCDADSKSANNAIHLSRLLMSSVDLPGFRRPGDGQRPNLCYGSLAGPEEWTRNNLCFGYSCICR
jgi:hypothetical protein